MTCVRSSGLRRAVRASPAQSFSMGARCSRPARVGLGLVTTATNANAAAKSTWPLILWGQLLAVHGTLANEQERAQVGELARQVPQATGQTIKVAFADQGYTGEEPILVTG
jgi:hypothetical protein